MDSILLDGHTDPKAASPKNRKQTTSDWGRVEIESLRFQKPMLSWPYFVLGRWRLQWETVMGLFDGTPLERPIVCDRCGLDIKVCQCPPVDTPPGKQSLKIRVEKRKRGKLVTVVSGFACSVAQMEQTLTAIKTQCGAGGTLDGQSMELQGDQSSRLPGLLSTLGYKADNKPRTNPST